jgi:hypothetical protein
MTYSYIEGNVPKLIVRVIFRNIPSFLCDLLNNNLIRRVDPLSSRTESEYSHQKTNQAILYPGRGVAVN